MKLRGALIVGLLAVGSFQPLFGETFKFKVTPNKEFALEFTVFGGPLVMLDACWSKAKTDLDWVIVCDYPTGLAIAAYGSSTEEGCEDLQVGIFDEWGGDGLVCVATLYSQRGIGKGNGAFRLTGIENSAQGIDVRAAEISLDSLPRFQEKLEQIKAVRRQRKTVE